MRFTRAAPALPTSSRTPPTSRAVAPFMGANSASTGARRFATFLTGLRTTLRTGLATRFLVFLAIRGF
jgi:hypothetical protein